MSISRSLARAALFSSLAWMAFGSIAYSTTPLAADELDAVAIHKVNASLLAHEGIVEVSIRLSEPALVEKLPKGAKGSGVALSRKQQQAHLGTVKSQQDKIAAEVARIGGRELARISKVLNVVVVEVDASALLTLADLPEVRSIKPLAQYELHLSETVPYIGAAAVQASGVTGDGISVAVLDSGIDYTHKNLGGEGTLAAYGAAYADPSSRDGLFPTAKVVGGYDFVGEVWPNGGLAPDDDPIDLQGHGTHVADIIAGKSQDGTRLGVAPAATLYAFKVCSAVASSCSGIAILQGLEASLDPNSDGDITDAVDVVNMSLGSSYGQIVDDSAAAVQNLTEYGVVVVCSAGNSGDKPYVAGSPSIAPGAISVAQTNVPGASAFFITIEGAQGPLEIRNTASLAWAPVDVAVSGEIVLGGLACGPYPAGTDFSGKVVLIDRGTCAISRKVNNAAKAGASGVIIANNVAGDPPSFSFAGPDDFDPIPALVISLDDGNLIKGLLDVGQVTASFGPSSFTPLVGSMVATSSRGPSFSFDTIKPDIGAPGASLSAEAGTGDGQTAFGGTSGAAPMVAGAAALVLQQHPGLLPHEVKARLMNTADRGVVINPISQPGVLAPVTRIGGGEVRVDRALTAETMAYDADTGIASLSFGYRAPGAFGEPLKFKRTLVVRNLGSAPRTYTLAAGFRDPADAVSGAVSVSFSASTVSVGAGEQGEASVFLQIDPTLLPDWSLNSGINGGNGTLLTYLEFDGYVTLDDGEAQAAVPWHVLPRKAADNQVQQPVLKLKKGKGAYTLRNIKGATAGITETFALTGVSAMDYPLALEPGSNFAPTDLAAVGVRTVGSTIQFAVATYEERTNANYPAEFAVYVDTTDDGTPDFVLFTAEAGGFAATGQNLTYVRNLATGRERTHYYTDADVNAQTAILTAPLVELGIAPGKAIGFEVRAFDNYFTGALSDSIGGQGGLMVYTPGQEKFTVPTDLTVAPGATVKVPVTHNPAGDAASPSQIGVLNLHRNAKPGAWWDILTVKTK